jgi:dolichol-phosphate mannosyltransferase
MPPIDSPPPSLSVVMPVHNEVDAIRAVIDEWTRELARLGIDYEMLVFDDGSNDGTARVLGELAHRHPCLFVHRHANKGHGPTVLRGYREARGEWVLQVDSDGEIPASAFEDLWTRREACDFLIGRRTERAAPLIRRVVTAASRLSVRALFGSGIHDVNAPYRLMRGRALRSLTPALPGDVFAPNVILTGLALRRGLRVCERPVPHVGRRHGQGSLGRLRVLRVAMRAFRETVAAAWRSRSG